MEKYFWDTQVKSTPEGVFIDEPRQRRDPDLRTADRPPEPEILAKPYDPHAPGSPTHRMHPNYVEYDDGTVYFKNTGEWYLQDGTQVDGPSEGAKPVVKTLEAREGGRIELAGGGMGRRAFMKILAGLASIPLIGRGTAKLTPKAAKVVETIKSSNAPGIPPWFEGLVSRVVKEGDDITKGAATVERQTVHSLKLPDSGTRLDVTQDLTKGDIFVDVGIGKHGFESGKHGQPVRLILQKGEWIEPTKTKKGIKTKDEFWVEEAEFTGGHPENIKFEDSVFEEFGKHSSDFSEVEKFATKKASGGLAGMLGE